MDALVDTGGEALVPSTEVSVVTIGRGAAARRSTRTASVAARRPTASVAARRRPTAALPSRATRGSTATGSSCVSSRAAPSHSGRAAARTDGIIGIAGLAIATGALALLGAVPPFGAGTGAVTGGGLDAAADRHDKQHKQHKQQRAPSAIRSALVDELHALIKPEPQFSRKTERGLRRERRLSSMRLMRSVERLLSLVVVVGCAGPPLGEPPDAGSSALERDAGIEEDGGLGELDGGLARDAGRLDAAVPDAGPPASLCATYPGVRVIDGNTNPDTVQTITYDGTNKGHLVMTFTTPSAASPPTRTGTIGSTSPVYTNWFDGRSSISPTACDFAGAYAVLRRNDAYLNESFTVGTPSSWALVLEPGRQYALNVEFDVVPAVVICGARGPCNWFTRFRVPRP